MKPTILVDKSFIQSLLPKEARVLRKHFYLLITPVFIQEMLIDIEKYNNNFEDTLRKLKILAEKMGGGGQYTITNAQYLFYANLLGCKFGKKPKVPIFDAEIRKAPDGSIGNIFDETQTEKLIQRWQKKNFLDEDISLAKKLLQEFNSYYSVNQHAEMTSEFSLERKFKTLDDLVAHIDEESLQHQIAPLYLLSASNMTHSPRELVEKAMLEWNKHGKFYFESTYEYAFFYTRLWLIYSLGLRYGLISASKGEKAAIDIQYFLYLPFCHAFCSQDKFHKDCFKYFQRPEQMFIWSPDFKQDLAQIALYSSNLTPEQKKNNERRRGSYPPPLPNSISVNLWNQVNGPWIEGRFGNRAVDMSEEEQKKVVDWVNELIKSKR